MRSPVRCRNRRPSGAPPVRLSLRPPWLGPRRVAEELAGDDHLLDLTGAFVDAEKPCVAIHALDRHAPHVAGAAVDLHGPVGDPVDHLTGEVLRARWSESGVLARVVTAG